MVRASPPQQINPGYQVQRDGPLTKVAAGHLIRIKDHFAYSIAQLAKDIGISRSVLHRILHDNHPVKTATTYRKIASFLDHYQTPSLFAAHSVAAETELSKSLLVPLLKRPFLLRKGLEIEFSLPENLTDHEAERLGYFFKSLVLLPDPKT